jgi:3-hydroxyacyl-CoA dehydrogenase/enoyl-CoA hydratase/3-hydroxybutyryl-CoA epimerase
MELLANIGKATTAAAERDGTTYVDHPGTRVLERMLELGRPSRLKGAGFYDYDADGRRQGLWPGLAEEFPVAAQQPPFDDVKDRLLFVEALETANCFEEGVITSTAAANIGSIMGIGFPPNTGGAAQFMTGYEARDGRIGLAAFLDRADALAATYGDRFAPTPYLRDLAANGGSFPG